MKERQNWVDVGKFLAIVAVIIDHTNGVLYTNTRVAYFSYYSVSLFILLMGFTTFWSYQNCNGSIGRKAVRKCTYILIPYIIATTIFCTFDSRKFDFLEIINALIHFNKSGPYYYVLLYMQLAIISPCLYKFIISTSGKKYLWIPCGIAVAVISSFTTRFSSILSVYGGVEGYSAAIT